MSRGVAGWLGVRRLGVRGVCGVLGLAVVAGCSSRPAAEPDAAAVVIDDSDPAWPEDVPIPPELDFPPYLTLLDATTVVVSWRTVAMTTGVVRFGIAEALAGEAASGTPASLHHVTLADLVPGSAYHYEVAIDGTTAVRRGVFVMPGRAHWRFMHLGEFHAPSESLNVVRFTETIRAFRPHVVVESGDMVDDGNVFAQWRDYVRTSAPWIGNVLLLPSHSNHVNGPGGNANLEELFVLPDTERWYTTRYGQVEFFTVDSTYAYPEVMTDEVPWLAGRAAAAHDGVDDPTFVVAAWHYPACSSQYLSRAPDRSWVQDNLVATLVANGGVDLILAAHDKYYERSTITGGIVHVITNLGYISPEIAGGNHPACTAEKTSRSHQSVGLFTVDGRTLAMRALDETGAELDVVTITR